MMFEQPRADEIFVFGSNLAGFHGSGAALAAWRSYGAETGVGEGLMGASYALPTMDEQIYPLPLESIQHYVETFLTVARERADLKFFVTRVGCGIAGYTDAQIAPMFAGSPSNVRFPEGWRS